MNVVNLPVFRLRKHVGGIRHLKIEAGELIGGEVAELSSQASRELAEIWFMPEGGSIFRPQMLRSAAVSKLELFDYCNEVGMRQRILSMFFTSLSIGDADWDLQVMERCMGFGLRLIVGHRTAMQLARDHGFLPDHAAEQHAVRHFAFGQ